MAEIGLSSLLVSTKFGQLLPHVINVTIMMTILVIVTQFSRQISPGDLPCDKGLSPPRTLVVEEDSVASVHPIGFPVVHHRPECQ